MVGTVRPLLGYNRLSASDNVDLCVCDRNITAIAIKEDRQHAVISNRDDFVGTALCRNARFDSFR